MKSYRGSPSRRESLLMHPRSILLALTVAATVYASTLAQSHSSDENSLSDDGDSPQVSESTSGLGFNEPTDAVTEIASLRRTIRLLPNDPDYRLKLAGALSRVGDPDAAIEECRAAIKLQPDDGNAHLQLGLILMAKQEWQAAASALGEAVRLEPNLSHAHYSLGSVYYSLGDVTAAVQSYRRTLDLQPHFPDAHYRLALLLRIAGRTREAVQHLETAAAGGVPQARLFLGNAYQTGQGVEKNLGLAIFWWMQAADLGQQTAVDSLSKMRRQALSSESTKQRRIELQSAFQIYRNTLWNNFPDISRPTQQQSLGKVLLEQNPVEDAVPVLLKECFALSEEAHAELAALYETGWERSLKPYDKNILACFESTSADGFAPAKKILARIYAKGLGVDADIPKAKTLLKGLPKQETQSLIEELRLP
ncbi:MAG TPA: tetratricopeptide repeat protein [Nitrospira sp.]|nr:tetratricopeptide repeat protein [Nitrospira sp.]